MGAAENTTKDSRCERQGKKAEGNKEGGARFEEDGIQSDFFFMTLICPRSAALIW